MAPLLDLESFLQEESAKDSFRGTGAFAEALESATERFQEFRFPNPDFWQTKLLQSAVAWGAQELAVTQMRDSTTFHFSPKACQSIPSGTELFRVLLHSDLSGSKPEERFGLAIRTLRERAGLPFLLVLDRGGEERPTTISDGHFFRRMSRRRQLRQFHKGPGLSLSVSHILDGETRVQHAFKPALRSSRALAIASRLREDSELCPLTLTLDSRPIDGLLSSPLWQAIGYSDLLAVVGMPDAEARADFRPPQALREDVAGRDFWTPSESLDSQLGFMVTCCGVGAQWSELILTADGIAVQRLPLFGQFPHGFRVILDARGLETDLAGSKLLDSPARTLFLRRALESALRCLRYLKAKRHDLLPNLSEFFDQDSKSMLKTLVKALDTAVRNFPRSFIGDSSDVRAY